MNAVAPQNGNTLDDIERRLGYIPSLQAIEELVKDLKGNGILAENDLDTILSELQNSVPAAYQMLTRQSERSLAERAIEWLKSNFLPGDIIELRAISPHGKGSRSLCENLYEPVGAERAVGFIRREIGHRNLYFGIQPRLPQHAGATKSCSAEDVHVHRHALLDLDQSADGSVNLSAARERLEACGPAAIVNTGGGIQALFRLPETSDNSEMVRRQQDLDTQSARIGADSVNDPPRIARLPWTVNIPGKSKRARGRDLTFAVPHATKGAAQIMEPEALVDKLKCLEGLAPAKNAPKKRNGTFAAMASSPESTGVTWSKDSLLAPSAELVEKAVAALPNDGPFDSHNPWVGVGYAIFGATAGSEAGRQAWLDWCSRWHRCSDQNTDESTWPTLHKHKSGWPQLMRRLFQTNPAAYREIKAEEAKNEFSAQPLTLIQLATCVASASHKAGSVEDLMETLIGAGVTVFHTPDLRPYLSFNGRNLQIGQDSPQLAATIIRVLGAKAKYFVRTRKAELIDRLEIEAIGPQATEEKTYVRVAYESEDQRVWIDLVDENSSVVELTERGWKVRSGSSCEVRFVRNNIVTALPIPQHDQHGGKLIERIRKHINLPPVTHPNSPDDIGVQAEAALIMALSSWFVPAGAMPHLAISGDQGAGKTSAAMMIKALIDPSNAPISPMPGNDRDLMVAVRSQFTTALDNLSRISRRQSDLLSQLATGATRLERRYYTNDDVVAIQATRGLIFTSIREDLIKASDLRERTVTLPLQRISKSDRRTKEEIDRAFEQERPALLALLFDALVEGLKRRQAVRQQGHLLLRMADAVLIGEAVAQALGWKQGLLIEAIEKAQTAAHEAAVATHPWLPALADFVKTQPGAKWSGTATDLYAALRNIPGLPSYPTDHTVLGGVLTERETELREAYGIKCSRRRESARRVIELAWISTTN